MTTPEQLPYFRPRAPGAQVPNHSLLDLVQGTVARRQLVPHFAGRQSTLDQIFEGCDFGDFRLQGLRERICHVPRVEVNAPLLNRVLTDPQGRAQYGVEATEGLHPEGPSTADSTGTHNQTKRPQLSDSTAGQGLTTRNL